MVMRLLLAPALLLATLLCAGRPEGAGVRGGASACGDSTRVTLQPAAPRPGALFLVRITRVPSGVQLAGEIGGQRLHFVPDSGGGAVSFGATTIESSGTVAIAVRCAQGETEDTLRTTASLARADYPVERLKVAPGFGREPDAALSARIARESARAREVADISHNTQGLWRGEWLLPRDARITSPFGGGREFNGTITSRHMGTDFAGATGATVRAANRGVVRIVDAFYYGGNVVYVDHGGGLTTAYLHLSRQDVAVGDTVERGTVVGAVGATGRVTGPHLHLIVRYGTTTVDPLSLFAVAGDSSARRVATLAR